MDVRVEVSLAAVDVPSAPPPQRTRVRVIAYELKEIVELPADEPATDRCIRTGAAGPVFCSVICSSHKREALCFETWGRGATRPPSAPQAFSKLSVRSRRPLETGPKPPTVITVPLARSEGWTSTGPLPQSLHRSASDTTATTKREVPDHNKGESNR
jgi:hypothetical protein